MYIVFGWKRMWRKMFFFSLDSWKNGDPEHGVSIYRVSQRQELRSSDSQPRAPLSCLLPLQCTSDDLEKRVLVMIGESNGSDSIIHVCIFECIMCIFIHSLSEEIWCFVNKSDMSRR